MTALTTPPAQQNLLVRDLWARHILCCCFGKPPAEDDESIQVTYHEYELDYNSDRQTLSSLLRSSRATLQAALRPSVTQNPILAPQPGSLPGMATPRLLLL